MARPLRIEFPGAVYHVTSRGNDKKNIFRDDNDRTIFLDILSRCCNRFHWLCHAYCLMGNHYHLVVETVDGVLSRGMRHLNGVYTQRFNWNHGMVGHIFQGRFKAVLIQKESHLLEACRYVVLNPVRAKVTPHPKDWQWSSYRGTCGIDPPPIFLTTDWILQQFGATRSRAMKRYQQFVREGINAKCLWDDLKSQILLGDEEFVDRFVDVAKGFDVLAEIPRPQRFLTRPVLHDIFGGVEKADREARNKAVREAVDRHGYLQKEVADYLRLHSSTITRILK